MLQSSLSNGSPRIIEHLLSNYPKCMSAITFEKLMEYAIAGNDIPLIEMIVDMNPQPTFTRNDTLNALRLSTIYTSHIAFGYFWNKYFWSTKEHIELFNLVCKHGTYRILLAVVNSSQTTEYIKDRLITNDNFAVVIKNGDLDIIEYFAEYFTYHIDSKLAMDIMYDIISQKSLHHFIRLYKIYSCQNYLNMNKLLIHACDEQSMEIISYIIKTHSLESFSLIAEKIVKASIRDSYFHEFMLRYIASLFPDEFRKCVNSKLFVRCCNSFHLVNSRFLIKYYPEEIIS